MSFKRLTLWGAIKRIGRPCIWFKNTCKHGIKSFNINTSKLGRYYSRLLRIKLTYFYYKKWEPHLKMFQNFVFLISSKIRHFNSASSSIDVCTWLIKTIRVAASSSAGISSSTSGRTWKTTPMFIGGCVLVFSLINRS